MGVKSETNSNVNTTHKGSFMKSIKQNPLLVVAVALFALVAIVATSSYETTVSEASAVEGAVMIVWKG
jgi:hypothetical protein